MFKKGPVYESVHGTPEFPFNMVVNVTSPVSRKRNEFIYHHWHRELEFILIQEGEGVIEVDTRSIQVREGQVVIINSGQLHAGYSTEGCYCKACAIIFDLSMMAFSLNDTCQQQFINPIIQGYYRLATLIRGEMPWEREVVKQVGRIVSLYMGKCPGYQLGIKACIYWIIFEMVQNNVLQVGQGAAGGMHRRKVECLKTVLGYIEQNYPNYISVKELADTINISVHHFYKFFKEMTGRTPVEYINLYRVDRAASMLVTHEIPVTEVAFRAGFENVSYFIKTFKKYKKVTPLQFRKQHR